VSNRGAYDPATVEFLRTVLDEAWDAMAPCHNTCFAVTQAANEAATWGRGVIIGPTIFGRETMTSRTTIAAFAVAVRNPFAVMR
jgi:hypothetical protein